MNYIQIETPDPNGGVFNNVWLLYKKGDPSLSYAFSNGGMYSRLVEKHEKILINEYGNWKPFQDQIVSHVWPSFKLGKSDILEFPEPTIKSIKRLLYEAFLEGRNKGYSDTLSILDEQDFEDWMNKNKKYLK